MASFFDYVVDAPADPILGVSINFKNDSHPDKLNLGVGAYRDENGQPYVLKCVKKAEEIIMKGNFNKEYLPIEGYDKFNDLATKLLYGENAAVIKEKRIVTIQSLSGTGALRLGAEFLKRFYPASDSFVYISNPTWGNHPTIFMRSGFQVKEYRYFSSKTNMLDFDGFLADIKAAPLGSIILLHACAHNPTGVDPTIEQWNKIADVMQERKHFPFFDIAYQGYATGDTDRDAAALRLFVDRGFELVCAQSFAKNFGLYSERVGTFTIVCKTAEITKKVWTQALTVARPMYSNPPRHGAYIVATVLGDKELAAEWLQEVKMMSSRIIEMRQDLYNALLKNGCSGNWEHIIKQIGMFTYTGLSPPQCEVLINKYHIYMLKNGRISMAGLTKPRIQYMADAIKDVVTNVK